jgi:hypothetical protein
MLRTLLPRFLLIIALLLTQLGGLTHGISHALEGQGTDHSLSHEKHCELCAAYAQLGSALSSHAIQFNAIAYLATPVLYATARFCSTVCNAYTARAPPYSA